MLAAESILQNRVLRISSSVVTLGRTWLYRVSDGGAVVPRFRQFAGCNSGRLSGCAAELGAIFLQAKLPIILDTSLWLVAIAAYLAALALDEIDFRGLLERIAEKRFHKSPCRLAMVWCAPTRTA